MSADLTTAKAHLRVTASSEDTLITGYLAAATAWIERYTGRKLAAAAVTETFTAFGDYIELSVGPVNSITSVTYLDAEGDSQTLADTRLQDGKIYKPLTGWPSILQYSTITVVYNAGYATTPKELEQAQLLLVGHFYQNREAVSTDRLAQVPLAVEALCGPFRLPTLR